MKNLMMLVLFALAAFCLWQWRKADQRGATIARMFYSYYQMEMQPAIEAWHREQVTKPITPAGGWVSYGHDGWGKLEAMEPTHADSFRTVTLDGIGQIEIPREGPFWFVARDSFYMK